MNHREWWYAEGSGKKWKNREQVSRQGWNAALKHAAESAQPQTTGDYAAAINWLNDWLRAIDVSDADRSYGVQQIFNRLNAASNKK